MITFCKIGPFPLISSCGYMVKRSAYSILSGLAIMLTWPAQFCPDSRADPVLFIYVRSNGKGHGCQAYTFHTFQHSCKFCKFWNKP